MDVPIIDELLKFRKFFKTDSESIFLSNRNTIPEVKLSGKEITISGEAHFKPGDQLSYVNLDTFNRPGALDKCLKTLTDATGTY